ncbi:MAG: hypothetical protein VX083_10055 [Pseudomonadota bacterium]|nr:hypothetical protein [Pseudomonadota bacterium]
MLDELDHLIDLQRQMGRKICKYAKRRRPNAARLDGLQQITGWVPSDMKELYRRYDGIEPPLMWEEYAYFWGHAFWETSRALELKNRTSHTRETFPLSDEISLSTMRGSGGLMATSLGGDRYILTIGCSVMSDVRYPAFDNFRSMFLTYIDALKSGAWTFDADGVSVFDEAKFADSARAHNTHADYWDACVAGTVDFKEEELMQGLVRPRLTPKSGRQMLAESGFDLD